MIISLIYLLQKKLWPDYGKNVSSVGDLWIQLLRFYSADFDFGTYVVSIRQKERLPRFEKLWTSKCMAIEDPFDLSHNLGVGLSRNSKYFSKITEVQKDFRI
jgi:terminal uridylyltransferase